MAPPVFTTPKGYTRGSVQTTTPDAVAQSVTRELAKMERAQPNMRTVQVTQAYDVDPRDRTILVDTTAGDVDINLRSAKQQLVLPLDIIKTSSDGNSVQVLAASGESIGGPLGALTGLVWAEQGVGFSLHPDGLGQWWVEGSAVSWGSVGGLTSTAPDSIKAIADLVSGVANTFPYYTGIAAAALATLTPYARTILAAATAANARTLLGLGSLAVLSTVTETELTLADVTTANVSITEHGFAPKAPNDATKYLDGTGAYSVPAGGGGGTLPAFPAIANLKVRLSARLSAITKSQGLITGVTDLSGNGFNATSSGSLSPRYVPKGFNFFAPGIYFDGTARLLISGLGAIAQPWSVVLVVQNLEIAGGDGNIYRDDTAGSTGYLAGGSNWSIFAGSVFTNATAWNDNRDRLPSVGPTTGLPAMRIDVANGASSIIGNNGVESTGNAGAGGLTTSTSVLYVGGLKASFGNSNVKMVLYEILIVAGALSGPERANLLTYYTDANTAAIEA